METSEIKIDFGHDPNGRRERKKLAKWSSFYFDVVFVCGVDISTNIVTNVHKKMHIVRTVPQSIVFVFHHIILTVDKILFNLSVKLH